MLLATAIGLTIRRHIVQIELNARTVGTASLCLWTSTLTKRTSQRLNIRQKKTKRLMGRVDTEPTNSRKEGVPAMSFL